MEPDPLVEVERERAEVGVEVGAGWEEQAPELAPVEIVSAPVAGLDFLIKSGLPATTSVAPSVAPRWQGDEVIIAVASGKGGTGKTLVATSLALSLSHAEYRASIQSQAPLKQRQ